MNIKNKESSYRVFGVKIYHIIIIIISAASLVCTHIDIFGKPINSLTQFLH